MRKKSLFLAFLLALTAVVPVHAVAAATVMRSEIALIEVTVPSTGRIILNPHGLPVEVDGETTTEQIASDTMPITNNGDAPVVVAASAVGQISEDSSMTFVSAPPPADSTEKEVFVYTEFRSGDGGWSGQYSGGENQILVSEGASEVKEVLTLDANAEGKFRLFGAMPASPADPWSSVDEIKVTVVFTFTPVDGPADAAAEEEEAPAEVPTEAPTETPAEAPVEEPVKEPAEAPAEEPAEGPAEGSAEEPAGEPTEEPAEAPTEGPAEEPAGEPTEVPVEGPVEEPAETPIEGPTEEPAGGPAEELTQPGPELPPEKENSDSVPTDGEEGAEIRG